MLWKPCDICLHFVNLKNEKPCCLECGIVNEDEAREYKIPYIRTISQYRKEQVLIPLDQLVGDNLRNQVQKLLRRKVEKEEKEQKKQEPQLYLEYIEFLRQNEADVLPRRKNRRRNIMGVYGENKRLCLEYLRQLTELTTTRPP